MFYPCRVVTWGTGGIWSPFQFVTMYIKSSIHPTYSIGGMPIYDLNGRISGYQPTLMTDEGSLNRTEHFMLELTKAVASGSAANPTAIVNRAQEIFEVLKKRIEDIEQHGLISDNKQ